MHLVDFPIPPFILYFSVLITIATLGFALWFAPWKAMLRVPQRQHLFFGAAVCLVVLWSMKIAWIKGFSLHPMGMTAATVIFGWRFAIILGALVLTALELISLGSWHTLSLDFILAVIIPASVALALIRLVQSWRSRNLFLFMLGVGFIGAMLGLLVDLGLVGLLALSLDRQIFMFRLGQELPILIMLLNVEGFLNGAVVTAMSVFAPHLVKSFDDRKYLG